MLDKFLVWAGFKAAPTYTWPQIIQNIRNGTWSIAQAARITGYSPTTIQAQLSTARYLAAHAASKAGAVLLPSAPAIIAGILIVGAIGAGVYMHKNWGKPSSAPVAPGRAMEPHSPYSPPATGTAGTGTSQSYCVVRVGDGILSVRNEADVKGGKLMMSSFRHGGTQPVPAKVTPLSGPLSKEAATQKLAGMIAKGTLRNPPLAGGYVASVGGRNMTIDDWGAADWGMLQRLTAK
jgi:hypothetical protein